MDFGMLTNLVKEALAPTWHRARVECLLEMLRGLFLTQGVNTCRLAQRMGDDVQFESHARRIRRLLAEQVFDWSVIGRLPPRLAGVDAKDRVVVAVDRTNWNFGATAINFLVISVVVSGVGVPIVWEQPGKKGNSGTSERLDLLERFPGLVPAHRIRVLLADREFIGKGWFTALQDHGVPYSIRIRNNQLVTLPDDSRIKVSTLAGRLTRRKVGAWPGAELDGVRCSLSLKRLSEDDVLAVVSHGLKRNDDPLEIYRLRRGIEPCLACLKTRGFNIEDTHLHHADRPGKESAR